MKKVFMLSLVLIFAGQFLFLAADTKKEAFEVILQNLKAMEAEDVDAVMETVHEDSPAYDNTKKMCETLFKMYDVKYEIKDMEVTKETDDTVEVTFTQITRKVSGPDFKDNQIKGVHILKKSGNVWKIYNTKMLKIDWL